MLQRVQRSIEERNANMTSSFTYLLATNVPTKFIPYACTDITYSTTNRGNNTSFKLSDKVKNMTNTHRATNTSSFRLSEKLQNMTSADRFHFMIPKSAPAKRNHARKSHQGDRWKRIY